MTRDCGGEGLQRFCPRRRRRSRRRGMRGQTSGSRGTSPATPIGAAALDAGRSFPARLVAGGSRCLRHSGRNSSARVVLACLSGDEGSGIGPGGHEVGDAGRNRGPAGGTSRAVATRTARGGRRESEREAGGWRHGSAREERSMRAPPADGDVARPWPGGCSATARALKWRVGHPRGAERRSGGSCRLLEALRDTLRWSPPGTSARRPCARRRSGRAGPTASASSGVCRTCLTRVGAPWRSGSRRRVAHFRRELERTRRMDATTGSGCGRAVTRAQWGIEPVLGIGRAGWRGGKENRRPRPARGLATMAFVAACRSTVHAGSLSHGLLSGGSIVSAIDKTTLAAPSWSYPLTQLVFMSILDAYCVRHTCLRVNW